MTTPPIVSITDELITELERAVADATEGRANDTLEALLAERAELKRDAERYRWLREGLVGASFDWDDEGMTVIAFQMPDSITVSANCDKVIDDAMQAAQ